MGKRYKRLGFTEAQRVELWDRWQQGESKKSIGRALGKPSSCIWSHLKPYGGIRPRPRRRSSVALSLAEREEISRGVAAGRSMRAIAIRLGRSPSTVSRELSRNGGRRRPISEPCSRHLGLSRVSWPSIGSCRNGLPRSSSLSGHRSRSRVGSSTPTRKTGRTTCLMRRSIEACSFKPAACLRKS